MLTDPDDISAQFSVFSGIEAEARNRDQIIVPENDTPLDDIITPIETVVEKKQKQIAIQEAKEDLMPVIMALIIILVVLVVSIILFCIFKMKRQQAQIAAPSPDELKNKYAT